MAGAVVPLILEGVASLAPTVIDLITRLVHGAAPVAEQKFGPKMGPVKFGDVFAAVIDAMQKAAASGAIPKALPSDEAIKAIIQTVVTSMNLSGLLDTSAPTPTPTPAQTVTLKPGQSLTIQVAA